MQRNILHIQICICTAFALIISCELNGQIIERGVISSFGHLHTNATFEMDGTLGETIIFSSETSTNMFSQGFHQPTTIVSICQTPHEETLNVSACSSVELNGEIFDQSGSYIQLLIADDGCDSMLYVNVTLNALSNQISSIDNSLMAIQDNAIYAWTFCGNDSILSTSQVFQPSVSDEYQVTIAQDNCEVVSDCISFDVGIEELKSNVELNVFPNPTRENLQLEVKGSNERFGLTIYDAMGNMVMTEAMSSSKTKLSVGHFANGTYVIVLRSNFSVFTKTFVKGQ